MAAQGPHEPNREKPVEITERPLTVVSLTERAAVKIKQLMAEDPEGDVTVLRVAVQGGGCSGFQYRYDLVREPPAADDLVLARDHPIELIDPVSLEYLAGSEIDFVDELVGQSFQIRNPNATASCGCGTSFSL